MSNSGEPSRKRRKFNPKPTPATVIDLVSDDDDVDIVCVYAPVTPSRAPTVTAAAANRLPILRGNLALLMQQHWLDRLLHYGKTWEIRGRDTKVRGKIYLARKELIYGETRVVDSFAVTMAELMAPAARMRHHITDLRIVTYKTPHVWKFAETRIYAHPVTFTRKPGQVVWCRVNFERLCGHSIEEDRKYLCCDDDVGGAVVACSACDGVWLAWCLEYLYEYLD